MSFIPDITACLDVLKKGGLILYPTDTVWGLGCDATNETAVAKIYALKQRDEKKSMIVLLAEREDIPYYAKTPSEFIKNMMDTCVKPLTIIYPKATNLAPNVINEDNTIAIRIAKDEFCRTLIGAFGKAIVSTSANISGEKTPISFEQISAEVKSGVDYIVRYRQKDKVLSPPSRIIKWAENDEFTVIRE